MAELPHAQGPQIELEAEYTYPTAGRYAVVVKVIDTLGNEFVNLFNASRLVLRFHFGTSYLRSQFPGRNDELRLVNEIE